MRPEREYRRMAIAALDFIQKRAIEGKEVWKGQTPPTMEEVDSVIRDLSYFVGALKNYRSIRIQMEKEDEKCQSR
jgi:hypothetical protein